MATITVPIEYCLKISTGDEIANNISCDNKKYQLLGSPKKCFNIIPWVIAEILGKFGANNNRNCKLNNIPILLTINCILWCKIISNTIIPTSRNSLLFLEYDICTGAGYGFGN